MGRVMHQLVSLRVRRTVLLVAYVFGGLMKFEHWPVITSIAGPDNALPLFFARLAATRLTGFVGCRRPLTHQRS